jgi:hypothetical protein
MLPGEKISAFYDSYGARKSKYVGKMLKVGGPCSQSPLVEPLFSSWDPSGCVLGLHVANKVRVCGIRLAVVLFCVVTQ